jgi:uncharacterized membrane protein YeaQ/YmgE (transglycosylase-associated protein family)
MLRAQQFRGTASILIASPNVEFSMTGYGLLIFLFIGAMAGWLAGLIVRGFGFGLLGNIVVGIIGAFLAGWLLPALGSFRGRRTDRHQHHPCDDWRDRFAGDHRPV